MNSRIIVVFLMTFLVSFSLFADKKPRVAVMPIEDRTETFDSELLENAASYLRSKLVTSGQFVVIPREEQEKVMIREMRRESHEMVYDRESQVPLGKALAADSIMRGNITSFGGKYILALELYDLATESASIGGTADFMNSEKSLVRAIDIIVYTITRDMAPVKIVPETAPGEVAEETNYHVVFERSGKKLRDFLEQRIPGRVIGIIPFETEVKEQGIMLSDIYSKYLSGGNFRIVDRKDLGKVIEEIQLQFEGVTEQKNIDDIGSMTGADFILAGNMTRFQASFFINLKIVEVETGETIYVDSTSFRNSEFADVKSIEDMFPESKYPVSAAFRSLVVPGWGQFYNDSPVRGVIIRFLLRQG
jgi:curli biogenesis system outer membrane secretion channel CsgG